MALGMTLIIITGGIDLSVGSNLALVSVAVGFTFAGGPALCPLAILFGLVVGLAAGLFNSLFITFLDLHPLVVTLGTFALFQGLAYGLSERRRRLGLPCLVRLLRPGVPAGRCRASSFIFLVAVAVVWIDTLAHQLRALRLRHREQRGGGPFLRRAHPQGQDGPLHGHRAAGGDRSRHLHLEGLHGQGRRPAWGWSST